MKENQKNESKIEEKKKILREKVENESELINEIEVKKRTMESTKTVLNKMIEIDENLSETISSLSVQHFDKGSIEKFLQILKKEEDENRGILTDNL